MPALVRSAGARLTPNGWLDLVRQLLLFAGAYYLYRIVRGQVDGRAAAAFENARRLIDFERSTHTFVEPSIQAWATGSEWIIDIASYMYVNSHYMITTTALAFLYLAHNRSFYFVRNMFMVAMFLALVGYVVYPTAPPRFMPEWGFEDSVAKFTGLPSDSATVNALYNPFAAVPSMHVAFALMIGWPLARLVRWRVLKVFWIVYPFMVTFVVISTGNHFWTDAALGAMVAGVSACVSHALLARARPHAWAFSPAGAEATA
jgi:membrane-associated phospholipid phosphatase